MPKSHRKRRSSTKRNLMKSIETTTDKALPVVNKTLTTVGNTTKKVAVASIPVIEKGVGVVYGTMSTGLDLGVKGVKSVTRSISKRSRSASRSRSRSLAGGRRTRRRHHKKH